MVLVVGVDDGSSELTKARQATVKGNIAVCVMCEAKKGEAMATNDL